MDMLLGNKLKQARLNKGLTQLSLSKLTGIKNTVLSNWENSINKPDVDSIEKLCSVLGVSPNYFFVSNSTSYNSSAFPDNILPLPKTEKKPRLGTIACGQPILAVQNIEEYDDVPEGVHCDFTLKCKGDSMINARIYDGDIVYIREQPEVENGEIAAVIIGEEATLKRVYKENGQITLVPENSKYAPLIYVGDRLNEVRIIGKVVAFTSLVR